MGAVKAKGEEAPTEAADENSIRRPKKRYDDSQGDTIFLRNVSKYDTTEEGLKRFMEDNFGETVYCLICKEKETGESRGTAFVKFKDPAIATKCLEDFKDRDLQYKFYLDGRNLFPLAALTKDEANEVKRSIATPAETKEKSAIEKKKMKTKQRHFSQEKFSPSKNQAPESNKTNRAKKNKISTSSGSKKSKRTTKIKANKKKAKPTKSFRGPVVKLRQK